MSNNDNENSQDLTPRFPQLQQVTVSYTKDLLRKSQAVFIKNLLKDAPNLTRILINDSMALGISPGRHELVNQFQLSCTNIFLCNEKRGLNCQIVRKRPNNVIKKVGRSGLEMITKYNMLDGWVPWMITLF